MIMVSATECSWPTTDNFSALLCSGPFRHTQSDLMDKATEMGKLLLKRKFFFSVISDSVLRNYSAGTI